MLPTLWQQFGEGPFLFQHDNAPVHKARSIQKWFVEFGVEDLDWPAQSPDLNPNEYLCDELECPTSLMLLWLNGSKSSAAMFKHLVESIPRRVKDVIAAKGGTNSILMSMSRSLATTSSALRTKLVSNNSINSAYIYCIFLNIWVYIAQFQSRLRFLSSLTF